jgi:hypothetical protein
MKQFVAMTDEFLYRPDALPGPLVPYQCGVFCWHRLREEASTLQSADAIQIGVTDTSSRAALSA